MPLFTTLRFFTASGNARHIRVFLFPSVSVIFDDDDVCYVWLQHTTVRLANDCGSLESRNDVLVHVCDMFNPAQAQSMNGTSRIADSRRIWVEMRIAFH